MALRLRVLLGRPSQVFRPFVDITERDDVDLRAGRNRRVVRPSLAADADRRDAQPLVGSEDARPARGGPCHGSGRHGGSLQEATTGNVLEHDETSPHRCWRRVSKSGGSNEEVGRARSGEASTVVVEARPRFTIVEQTRWCKGLSLVSPGRIFVTPGRSSITNSIAQVGLALVFR